MNDAMSLAEMAETSGVPARTIRFYIARGILDGPVKAGRGAVYTVEHLARLERIKQLQGEGRTLAEIARGLGGAAAEPGPARPTPWWQHAVAEDVTVWVRAGVSPWRMKEIRAAVDELARRVGPAAGAKQEEQGER